MKRSGQRSDHHCKDFSPSLDMEMDRLLALSLLQECTGDEIWSLDYCRQRRVPEAWTEELLACFESGYRTHRQTIYTDQGMVNQYEGVRDVDLACKLGEWLGVHVDRILEISGSRTMIVREIREAVEEG